MQSSNLVRHQTEDDLIVSPENQQATSEMVAALVANDMEEVHKIAKKMILPLDMMKAVGKDFVHRYGFPTTAAELANDTEWLK